MDTADDAYGPDEKQERLRHVETMLEAVLMQLAQQVFDALDEHG